MNPLLPVVMILLLLLAGAVVHMIDLRAQRARLIEFAVRKLKHRYSRYEILQVARWNSMPMLRIGDLPDKTARVDE